MTGKKHSVAVNRILSKHNLKYINDIFFTEKLSSSSFVRKLAQHSVQIGISTKHCRKNIVVAKGGMSPQRRYQQHIVAVGNLNHQTVILVKIRTFGVPSTMQKHHKWQFTFSIPIIWYAHSEWHLLVGFFKEISTKLVTFCLP